MAARAVPAQGKTFFVCAEQVGIAPDQLGPFFSIIVCCRKSMLRGQAILHGNDAAVTIIGQLTLRNF
jgi:hypothetical protein